MKHRITQFSLLALAALSTGHDATASEGDLDTTFGLDGVRVVSHGLHGEQQDAFRGMAVAADGRIQLVGNVQGDGRREIGVIALSADGALSSTMAFFPAGLPDVDVVDAAMQSDMLIVAGQTSQGWFVCRLPGNYLDASFAAGPGTPGGCRKETGAFRPSALLIQSDGRILLGGHAGSPQRGMLVRLDADGYFDTAFGDDGAVTLSPSSSVDGIVDLAQTPAGDLVALVDTSAIGGESGFSIAGFRGVDGQPDVTYGPAGVRFVSFQPYIPEHPWQEPPPNVATVYAQGRSVRVLRDGMIVIGGTVFFDVSPPIADAVCLAIAGLRVPAGDDEDARVGYCTSVFEDFSVSPAAAVAADDRLILGGAYGGRYFVGGIAVRGEVDAAYGALGPDSDHFHTIGQRMVVQGNDVLVAGTLRHVSDNTTDFFVARHLGRTVFADAFE